MSKLATILRILLANFIVMVFLLEDTPVDNGPIGTSVVLWVAFVFVVLALILRPARRIE